MKILDIVLTLIISLLSIAAGLAKVMQLPQEMEFLTGLGLNLPTIFTFGMIQVLAGVITMLPKTKKIGSSLLFLGFLVSAILVYVSGNFQLAMISTIPVTLAGFIIYTSFKNATNQVVS